MSFWDIEPFDWFKKYFQGRSGFDDVFKSFDEMRNRMEREFEGFGEKYLLKVAAKHADRYNLFFGSPSDIKGKISLLKEYCKSLDSNIGTNHHKDIQYSVVLPCIVRDSEEEVNKIIEQYKREDKTTEQYLKDLVGGITIGVPERILEGIHEYLDLGVTHFIFQFIWLNEKSLKLFNSKVMRKI